MGQFQFFSKNNIGNEAEMPDRRKQGRMFPALAAACNPGDLVGLCEVYSGDSSCHF